MRIGYFGINNLELLSRSSVHSFCEEHEAREYLQRFEGDETATNELEQFLKERAETGGKIEEETQQPEEIAEMYKRSLTVRGRMEAQEQAAKKKKAAEQKRINDVFDRLATYIAEGEVIVGPGRFDLYWKHPVCSWNRGAIVEFLAMLGGNATFEWALRSLVGVSYEFTDVSRTSDHRVYEAMADAIAGGRILIGCRSISRGQGGDEEGKETAPPMLEGPVIRGGAGEQPESDTFPAGHDAAAQIQAMITAAEQGVPFCEECARAAAARNQ